MDPSPWSFQIQLLVKLQCLPADQHVRYVAFQLTDAAQLWFFRSTGHEPMNEWANLTQHIVRNFVPSIDRETLGDLAQSRHADTVDNYNFAAYVLHVGITSELLQITLLIAGLPDPL
jgi:hypothetical protein